MCHNPLIKEHFSDGFVFIELGPQVTDPSIKLRAIHKLLTGEQCDSNIAEQKIYQLTGDSYRNLLVIIDDVWYVEDAEPLVKAFSHCKTILTTRMNDIEQYLPSQQSVTIGPMRREEAVSLLTSGVIDISQLSQEDVSLLDELAQDVHMWPLLLSLIRGQLSHCLKQYHSSQHEAIQKVQTKLRHKGLTAFDKNKIGQNEHISKSRKLAVKACIEMTMELLTKSLSDKLKSLTLWTGISTSLQTDTLNDLWNISKEEAEDTANKLWRYGLLLFIISANNITQHCVEVHAVISQYIIENIDSNEVLTLSPLGTAELVYGRLYLSFQLSCGPYVHDPSLQTPIKYLNYKLNEAETMLPVMLKIINMYTAIDPHHIILLLQAIKEDEPSSADTMQLLSSLSKEIDSMIYDCKQVLNDVHKLCRKLNQKVQKNLNEKRYSKLTQTIEEYIKSYPLFNVIEKAVNVVKKIRLHYDDTLLHNTRKRYEHLQMMQRDYHPMATLLLPRIQLFINLHEQITCSLAGSHDIEQTYNYVLSGNFIEECKLVKTNQLIKLQEVAPNYVKQQNASY